MTTNIENLIKSIDGIELYDLPLFYDSNFKYTTNINGTDFIFQFKWNNTYEFWSIEIYDQYETLIVTVKVVPDYNLYKPYNYKFELNTPVLLSFNVVDPSLYPTQFNFGNDHKLAVTNLVFTDG